MCTSGISAKPSLNRDESDIFNRGRVAGVAVAPEGDVFDRCCKNIEPNAMHSTKNKITDYLNGLILKITNCLNH